MKILTLANPSPSIRESNVPVGGSMSNKIRSSSSIINEVGTYRSKSQTTSSSINSYRNKSNGGYDFYIQKLNVFRAIKNIVFDYCKLLYYYNNKNNINDIFISTTMNSNNQRLLISIQTILHEAVITYLRLMLQTNPYITTTPPSKYNISSFLTMFSDYLHNSNPSSNPSTNSNIIWLGYFKEIIQLLQISDSEENKIIITTLKLIPNEINVQYRTSNTLYNIYCILFIYIQTYCLI